MTLFLRKLILEKDSQAFWLSFIICLLACCAILFIVAPITGLSQNFGAGNDGYIQLARNIVAGNGYVFEPGGAKVFHRPPLYPAFLVPVALFSEYLQRYIIILPQSLLVGLTGFLIFKIARILFNLSVARISLFLFLINPWVYWNAKNPMTAVIQMALYLLFIYLFCRLFHTLFLKIVRPQRIWPQAVCVGIVSAALSLIHAAMLPVSIILLFVLFIIGSIKRYPQAIVSAVISTVILVVLIAPWTYRNYRCFGRFIPIAGGGGLAYFNGNVHWKGIEPEPQRKGETYIDASLRVMGLSGTEKELTAWMGFKDIALEDATNKKMAENIKKHPVIFVKKVILNAIEYYFPIITYHFQAVKIISIEQIALTAFHLVLWIAAIAGIFCSQRTGLLLLTGIFIYSIWYFPFATFIGHSLYTLGTIPFLSILAGAGLCSLRGLFNRAS